MLFRFLQMATSIRERPCHCKHRRALSRLPYSTIRCLKAATSCTPTPRKALCDNTCHDPHRRAIAPQTITAVLASRGKLTLFSAARSRQHCRPLPSARLFFSLSVVRVPTTLQRPSKHELLFLLPPNRLQAH